MPSVSDEQMERHKQSVLIMNNRLCLVFFLLVSNFSTSSGVTVTLSTGKVTGLKLVSAVNKVYVSFQGIPYAVPPIGYLRFKPPQPPESWNGTLEAFYARPACSQPWKHIKLPERYSEDCLYINVYTPHIEPPEDIPLPVMVWIHGGKHYEGSSTKYKYGPDFLITGGVVLVTFDYRLGVFGNLNMNTRSAQGNAGLKDIIAALKWVQKEIKHFGGDPNKVTIFGSGSGGQDVNCLYISPLAQGLFHRAISQSAKFCGTSHNAHATAAGRSLARLLGCDYRKPEDSVTCLRDITAQVLAERQMDVSTSGAADTPNPFTPSVEEDQGEEMVVPVDPMELLHASQSSVPYLLGLNSGEGIMEIKDPKDFPNQFCDFERNFVEYIPNIVKEKSSDKALQYITKILKKFYIRNEHVSREAINHFINFMTDKQFSYDIITYAKTLSTHAPIYLYLFAFHGAFEEPNKPTDGMNLTGVGHGRELGYLFFRNSMIENHNHMLDFPLECEIVTKMVQLWTNFATYGNPTPFKEDPVLKTIWLPINNGTTQHLIINQSLVMNTRSLFPKRMRVWDEVYQIADQDISEASWSIAIAIVAAVSVLSVASLVFLLYDCCCREPDLYEAL